MGGKLDDETIIEAQKKIIQLERQLDEIEMMKKAEPEVRRQLRVLREKVGDRPIDPSLLEEDNDNGDAFDPQKRLKALNKKLQQIAALKEKDGELDPEARAKIRSEAKILREVAAIKAGVPFDEKADAELNGEPESAFLPSDPAEREKRCKAIKKKLTQIATLKQKPPEDLDPEAKAKVASERKLQQELTALEKGDEEVVFHPPNEDELIEMALQERIEVEKKIKAVKKKLSQIDALKEKKGPLTPEEKSKVDSEATLKKELGAHERELGVMHKQERDRVAKRLGDDVEKPKKGGKK